MLRRGLDEVLAVAETGVQANMAIFGIAGGLSADITILLAQEHEDNYETVALMSSLLDESWWGNGDGQAGGEIKFVTASSGALVLAVPRAKGLGLILRQLRKGEYIYGSKVAASELRQGGLTTQHIMNLMDARALGRSVDSTSTVPRVIFQTDRVRKARTLRGYMLNEYPQWGGKLPIPNGTVHHVLPQGGQGNNIYRRWFASHGYDVNDPRYLRLMSETDHRYLENELEFRVNIPGMQGYAANGLGERVSYNEYWRRLIDADINGNIAPITQVGGIETILDNMLATSIGGRVIRDSKIDDVQVPGIWVVRRVSP